MAVQSIWVKWPRCTLQTLIYAHTHTPLTQTWSLSCFYPSAVLNQTNQKLRLCFVVLFLLTDTTALQLGPGFTMLSKRWTQFSKTLSLSFFFLFTFYFFDSHLLSPIRLSSFFCYTLNHKSNRPATAPSASPMHHADLGESIDSAFSLVRLLLLLSWALSVSGPKECGCVWVVVPQGPNRTIHTHTHTHTHIWGLINVPFATPSLW